MIPSAFSAQRLHGAIALRRSTRVYDGKPLSAEFLADIGQLAESTNPFGDVAVEIINEVPAGFFKGIIGSYFSIDDAPSAIVLSVSGADPNRYWHLGYIAEALVLEATARGVDSCWVAGSFSREVARAVASLPEGNMLVAAVAFGHGTESPREARRRPLSKIGPGFETWPAWARVGLEAARLAPSAVNRQPWRFSLDRRQRATLHVGGALFSRSALSYVGCGIAALHFELGAATRGVDGVWDESNPNALVFEPVGAVPVEISPREESRASARMSTALGAQCGPDTCKAP